MDADTRKIDWRAYDKLKTVEEVRAWGDVIEPWEVTAMVREAYAKGNYGIAQSWGEDEDVREMILWVNDVFFIRQEADCEEYRLKWAMALGEWSERPYFLCLEIDDEGDDLLDSMMMDKNSIVEEWRENYLKWWRMESGKDSPHEQEIDL